MTRIDFYILSTDQAQLRQRFVYKLLQKPLKLGHKIYLYCQDEHHADLVSQELWQQAGFLPHKIAQSDAPDCAIEVGFADKICSHSEVLINLSDHIPHGFSRFERLSEIVTQDTATLNSTRQNYRFYKERNYPLFRHHLDK